MGKPHVETIDGVLFNVENIELQHKFDGSRQVFTNIIDPVIDEDAGISYGHNNRIIKYISSPPNPLIWQITDEAYEEAVSEAKVESEKDKKESSTRHKQNLTNTWEDICQKTGSSMHDLFPSVFEEGE